MAAFLFKIFTLTLRTAAKPLAQRFQAFVLSHPTLRPRVVKFAQAVHRVETRVTRSAEGKTGKVFVGDLSDENAMDLAGKIVSEAFVYAVAVGVVAFEYNRQSKKDSEKARKEGAYKQMEETRYREQLEAQRRHEERLAALERRLDAIAGRWEAQLMEQEAQQEAAKRQLQRSNSFYGMFSLSRS
ncbi:hypothetical protein WJX81_008079 [Elliptochloris bilobata]|uniref:OPA3-like protein n=1 Tax=Elliptochloris bilobata TaxID=381761 RepID=A0AAW1RTL2_9CHLO